MSPSPCSISSPDRLAEDLSGVSLSGSDTGSWGTIAAATGSANHPATPKRGGPSFAAVVSSSFNSAGAKSPLSAASSPPASIQQPWRKHASPPRPTSLDRSPLCDNTSNCKNSVPNGSSFNVGNGIATINTFTQSSLAGPASSNSAGFSCSRVHNMSHTDAAQDSGDDDVENDQEDTESSDLEICLNSVDSRTRATVRVNVVGTSSLAYSPGSTNLNSSHSNPQSPFHFLPPAETEHMTVCIATNQGGLDSAQTLEKCVTAVPFSALGTYGIGNGHIHAHNYGLGVSATTSISNDAGSISAPHFGTRSDPVQCIPPPHPHKPLFAQPPNSSQSAVSASSRDPTPLPKLHQNILSLGDSNATLYTQSPSPNATVDLGRGPGSLLNRNALTLEIGATTANAGSHQKQMGISGTSDGSLSPIPTTNHAALSSSVSEPILNGNGCVDNSDSFFGNGNFNSHVKIPNVYINGLPPHFPEDELFNLCTEFGPIRSVRTFTRHVRDSESGYGFVLFENLDDADRCIVSLRRFRNLHPTFSKQIHKIPGTSYSVGPSTSPSAWNLSTGDTTGKGTFKAKMESLHDPSSTNLYMEGLPLTITAAQLISLVAPHKIVSARGFPTKLSKPPRAIVFVRLDTRVGAEEIIERLHGWMMEDGERLSVRFADSSEQKELRRTERVVQEGDTSPSQLTIAQASLLNLRGQGLRPDGRAASAIGSSLTVPPSARGFATSISAPDFSSSSDIQFSHFIPGHPNSNAPLIGNAAITTRNGLDVDYSLSPAASLSVSPYDREPYVEQQYGTGQSSLGRFGVGRRSPAGDPMLLDSLRANSTSSVGNGRSPVGDVFNSEGDLYAHSRNNRLRYPHQVHGAAYGPQRLQLPTSHSLDSISQGYVRPLPAYTRSGYTPTEEYIMRVHAESAALSHPERQHQQALEQQQYMPQRVERGRPARLDINRQRPMDLEDAGNISVGMRAYRAQASLTSPSAINSSDSLAELASMANTGGQRVGGGTFGQPTNGVVTAEDQFHAHGSLNTLSMSNEPSSYQWPMPFSPPLPISDEVTSQLSSPDPNDTIVSAYHQHGSTVHTRSTTLPQKRPSAIGNNAKGHHQHNSMSMPKMNLGTPQHASVARLGGFGNSNLAESSTCTIYETDAAREGMEKQVPEDDAASNIYSVTLNAGSSKTLYSSSSPVFGDVDHQSSASPLSPSSSLISPTLTYGSQTPSTLSPATPFFGSFNHNMESFDKAGEQPQPLQKQQHSVGSVLRSGNC